MGSSLSTCLVLWRLRCGIAHPPQAALFKKTPSGTQFPFDVLKCARTLVEMNHSLSKDCCALNKESRLKLAERLIRGTSHVTCSYSKPWVRKIPWRRAGQPTPVFLPGEFHEQRGLEGCSPWGHKEFYTTNVKLPERRSSSSAPRRDSAEPRPRGCSGLGEPRPALPSF